MAIDSNFTKSLFSLKNNSNDITFNMYALGKAYEIVIDDTVPVYKPVATQSYFVMAEGVNNVMWGPMLEKGFAKFMGSYEKIATGGVSSEAIRAMANLPGFLYKTSSITNLWSVIDQALA